MAPIPTAAKAERLLNLVIALVNTRQYRSAAWIRRNVAGYGDARNDEAFARMFERDKTELRELTVPLETNGEDGYRIPPNEFSLPELHFTPEETAAVGLAARLWSTTSLQSAGEQALRKLRDAGAAGSAAASSGESVDVAGRDSVLQPRVRTADPAFGPLQAATLSRRQVRFDYRKQPADAGRRRRLQPWGLVSFRGRWYVIGHDLDRRGQRTFRLSRITGDVVASGKAGSYLVPADVDLLEQVRVNAEPTSQRTAELRVRPGRAIGLRRGAELISAASGADPDSAGSHFDVLQVPITGLWDTARKVAASGPDVQVIDPPDLRDAVQRLLRGSASMGAASSAAGSADSGLPDAWSPDTGLPDVGSTPIGAEVRR